MAVEQCYRSNVPGVSWVGYFEWQAPNGMWIDRNTAYRIVLMFGIFDRNSESIDSLFRKAANGPNNGGCKINLRTGAILYYYPGNGTGTLFEGMEFFLTGYNGGFDVRESILAWE